MIFTFKGYNTYIFDLDSKGKALVLKNGFLDLGDPATPDNLGLVRLDHDKVIMDLNNDSTELFGGQEGQTLVIESDDTVQIANNQLNLHLNYDTSGNLLGGEFILQKDEPTHTTLDDDEEDTDTTRKTTTTSIIATETAQAASLDDMPTIVDPPQKATEHRLKTNAHHPGRHESRSRKDSAVDDSGDVFEKLDQFARDTSVIERTVYSDDLDGEDKTPSDSGEYQDKSASDSNSDSRRAREKLEKLDQFARETSVIERTVYSDDLDGEDKTPSDSGKDQDGSASNSSSDSRRARKKLEKLDQFARETSVIERTVYSDDEEEDPLGDTPSNSGKGTDGGHASGSSSDSRKEREKLEKLDQLARETSIIEHTSFSEIIDEAAIRRDSKPKIVKAQRLLRNGAGFKKDILNGKYDYTVKKFIGQGGFAEVYKVEDIEGNPFALKVLRPDLVSDADHIYSMFSNEVSIGRSLSHGGLVRTLESGVDAEYKLRYCIMEFVDGKNLSYINSFFINKSYNLHYLYSTLIILKIAKVLDYLSEKGVVHRDIKLQNVMVDLAGDVKVLDLGIARQHYDTSPRKPNEPPGTFSYMPIGQLNRMDPVDVRLDIYSLGVLYFRLLTRQPPIPSLPVGEHPLKYYKKATAAIRDKSATPDPRKKDRTIPDSVAAINMRMLEQDVGKRYASAKDLIADLRKVVDENMKEKEVKAELSRLCRVIVDEVPYRPPKSLPVPRNRAMRFAPYVALILCLLIPGIVYHIKKTIVINTIYEIRDTLEEKKKSAPDTYNLVNLENSVNDIFKQDVTNWSSSSWESWIACLQQKDTILDFQNKLDEKVTSQIGQKRIQKVWSDDERAVFKDLLPVIMSHSSGIEDNYQSVVTQFNENSRQLKEDIENLRIETKDDCMAKMERHFNEIQFIYYHEKYLNDSLNLNENNLVQFLDDNNIKPLQGYLSNPEHIENDKKAFMSQIGKLSDILTRLSKKEIDKRNLVQCDDDMRQLESMATNHSSNQEANELQDAMNYKKDAVKTEIDRKKVLSDFNDIIRFSERADEMVRKTAVAGTTTPDSLLVEAVEKDYANANMIYAKYGNSVRFEEKETEELYRKAQDAYNRLDVLHRTIDLIRIVEGQYNHAKEKGKTIEALVKGKNSIKAKEEFKKLEKESSQNLMQLKDMGGNGVFDHYKTEICNKFDKLLEDYHRTVITEDAELLKDYVEDLKSKVVDKMETDVVKHFDFLNPDSGKNEFDSQKYLTDCKAIYGNIEKIESEKTNDPENILENRLNEARKIKDKILGIAQDMDDQEIKSLLSRATGLSKSMDNLESTLRSGVKDLAADGQANGYLQRKVNEQNLYVVTANGSVAVADTSGDGAAATDQEIQDLNKIIGFHDKLEENIKEIIGNLSSLGDAFGVQKERMKRRQIPDEAWKTFEKDFGIMTGKAEETEGTIGDMRKKFADLKNDYNAFQKACEEEFEKNLNFGKSSMDSLANLFNALNQNAKKLKNRLDHEPYKNVVKNIQKRAQDSKEMIEAVSYNSGKAHDLLDVLKAETTKYLDDYRKVPRPDAPRNLEEARKHVDDVYNMFEKEIINLKNNIGENLMFSKKIDAFNKEAADVYGRIKQEEEKETIIKAFNESFGIIKDMHRKIKNQEDLQQEDLESAFKTLTEHYGKIVRFPDKTLTVQETDRLKKTYHEAESLYKESQKDLEYLEKKSINKKIRGFKSQLEQLKEEEEDRKNGLAVNLGKMKTDLNAISINLNNLLKEAMNQEQKQEIAHLLQEISELKKKIN